MGRGEWQGLDSSSSTVSLMLFCTHHGLINATRVPQPTPPSKLVTNGGAVSGACCLIS